MALPVLNEAPKYQMTIPSTGQNVRFRPFLVKEEKVMMVAMESENEVDILNTITDTISACVIDELDTSKLTTFDVEYSFLQIRAKSVGESVTIVPTCESCDHKNEVKIMLDDIKIDIPKVDSLIEIDDNISVEMHWPTYREVMKQGVIGQENQIDQIFSLIRTCISSIQTPEERFATADHSAEEMNTFIESMNTEQFAKIQEYVESMPRLTHDVNFNCANCGTANTLTLEGMQSFFS